ncbi:MAG: GNAT family N-acetyltransferase [Acidobacteriaceae bacterium]
MDFEVRELRAEDIPRIAAADGGAAWHGGAKKWDQRLAEQASGKRLILVAVNADDILGYGAVLWASGHAPFREAGIPEMMDVMVAERGRNHGVGTRIIHALEERTRAAGYKKIGVAVGHFSDYEAAQRLYVHLGYAAYGEDANSGDPSERAGEKSAVDDDLVLWLVKSLDSAPGDSSRRSE